MYNRNEIIENLIKIRKEIYQKEVTTSKPPCKEDVRIKQGMDSLILGVIGDFLNEEDRKQLDNILMRVICNDISTEMAMVAIREIAYSYFSPGSNQAVNQRRNGDEQLTNPQYKKGYR